MTPDGGFADVRLGIDELARNPHGYEHGFRYRAQDSRARSGRSRLRLLHGNVARPPGASSSASPAATSGRSSRAHRARGPSSTAPATSTTTSSSCPAARTGRSPCGPTIRGLRSGRSGGSTGARPSASIRPSSAGSRTASARSSLPTPSRAVRSSSNSYGQTSPTGRAVGSRPFRRRRRDLGGQLDHGVPPGSIGTLTPCPAKLDGARCPAAQWPAGSERRATATPAATSGSSLVRG